ncbi:response regulator [Halomicronema hongdechloris]|nr:response regulator [Halomicronema hongdechloris]
MVVDGHEESLYLTASVLEGLDAEVLAVNSAQKALRKLPIFQPKILISELRLPDEDGYWLLGKVKAFADCHNLQIPAIALTTQASLAAEARALSVGFCRHIAKPYDFETLIETVAQLVETVAQFSEANPQKYGHCQDCA